MKVFYDFRSPGAYLANRLLRSNGFTDVNWVPVSLLEIEGYSGRPMGFNNPQRAAYTVSDLTRTAQRLAVPFAIPDYVRQPRLNGKGPTLGRDHPIDSDLALRGACVAKRLGRLDVYNEAVFNALWGAGQDLAKPGVISSIARQISLGSEDFLQACDEPEISAQMALYCDEANQLGVFELPTFVIGKRLVCGYDRIDAIKYEINE